MPTASGVPTLSQGYGGSSPPRKTALREHRYPPRSPAGRVVGAVEGNKVAMLTILLIILIVLVLAGGFGFGYAVVGIAPAASASGECSSSSCWFSC